MTNIKSTYVCFLIAILLISGLSHNYASKKTLQYPNIPLISTDKEVLILNSRRQELTKDKNERRIWKIITERKTIPASELAIIICDMWDNHTSRGAKERTAEMAPKMNKVVSSARNRGVTIIHAPSETMNFYEGTPARERIKNTPHVIPPEEIKHDDVPLPVDASDGGSDTDDKRDPNSKKGPWTREIATIEIDQEKDAISDNGKEIYSYLQKKGINNVIIMGVHTNMCILNRTFAIKQMTKWGVNIMLCRDLTDAMYNPAKPPYVSHEEGTRLIIEYIEKFWCPTVESRELVR